MPSVTRVIALSCIPQRIALWIVSRSASGSLSQWLWQKTAGGSTSLEQRLAKHLRLADLFLGIGRREWQRPAHARRPRHHSLDAELRGRKITEHGMRLCMFDLSPEPSRSVHCGLVLTDLGQLRLKFEEGAPRGTEANLRGTARLLSCRP